MATTVFRTEETLSGPWLLDEAALRELDSLFQGFRAAATDGTPPSLSVILSFGEEKSLNADSLKEIESQPEILSALATGLDIALQSPNRLFGNDVEVSATRARLTISVRKETLADPYATFNALHRWAMNHRESWPLRFWNTAGFALGGATAVVGGVGLLSMAVNGPGSRETDIARQLVTNGVNEKTRDEALRLLLAKAYSVPAISPAAWPIRTVLIAAIALAVVVYVLGHPPGLIIGIGKGDQHLKNWRRWIKWAFVLIPGSVVLPFLLNILASKF